MKARFLTFRSRGRGVWWLAVLALAACESGPTGLAPGETLDLVEPWVLADPASLDLDANALFVAGEAASSIDRLESLLVVRQGRIAYERYYHGRERDALADVRSVTKSVVATLVGIAVESGAINSVDDPITDYLDGSTFRLRPEHEGVTVRHLLQMSSGIEWAETGGPDYNVWIQSDDHENAVLDRAVVADPGTTFNYNSGTAHLLGVVLEEAVGRPLPSFADEVLFAPLGIRNVVWEDLGRGFVNGGSGIDLRPRDLARMGQLYLQSGWSGDRRVVPEAWIAEVTAPRWSDLGSFGALGRLSYGYLWWHDLNRDAYLAWGYGGQFIYVVPDEELVIVLTTRWTLLSQEPGGSSALTREVLELITGPLLEAVN